MEISALRADWGFSPEQLRASWSDVAACVLKLMPAQQTRPWLTNCPPQEWILAKICACHNYYPRPETGLSYDSVLPAFPFPCCAGNSGCGFHSGQDLLAGADFSLACLRWKPIVR